MGTLSRNAGTKTSKEVEIINKLGLHARASAKLTQTAGGYASDIWLSRNGRRVNAKSIMGVMMLAAARGATLTIEANGPDEDEALAALAALKELGIAADTPEGEIHITWPIKR